MMTPGRLPNSSLPVATKISAGFDPTGGNGATVDPGDEENSLRRYCC